MNTIPSSHLVGLGAMVQKSKIEHIIKVVLATTRKALSQQISLKHFSCHGQGHLNHSSNHKETQIGFFNTWIHWSASWLPLYVLTVSSNHVEHWPPLHPHCPTSNNSPCSVLNYLVHALPWSFSLSVSLRLQLLHKLSLQCQVLLFILLQFLNLRPKPKS